ncbi:MAG: trehalose-phosphatase [Acidimicrobiales bacterium]
MTGGARCRDRLLAPFLADPARSAILTDFDGTLAPVVDDPLAARELPGVIEVLAALVGRYALVAVVSGRPLAFLQERLAGAGGLALTGLYGLERSWGPAVDVHPDAERWRPLVARVAEAAGRGAPAGVGVEHKGLAVTLHVRTAPGHAGWVARFAEEQAGLTGLEVHRGRLAVELRPPVAIDKGTVVAALAAGWQAVCYLGDDWADLEAFSGLAALRAGGVATVAVAVSSPEAPPELLAGADLVVDGPAGALDLLRALAA